MLLKLILYEFYTNIKYIYIFHFEGVKFFLNVMVWDIMVWDLNYKIIGYQCSIITL